MKKVDKRLDELTKILNKLYEDVALEKISEERYQAMAPKYEREQIELRSRREELAAEIAKNDEVYNNIQQFIPLIWKYTNIQELTPYILNELIEKIVVHEKVVGPDGIKTQQVDIYYKFIGLISRKAEGVREMQQGGLGISPPCFFILISQFPKQCSANACYFL